VSLKTLLILGVISGGAYLLLRRQKTGLLPDNYFKPIEQSTTQTILTSDENLALCEKDLARYVVGQGLPHRLKGGRRRYCSQFVIRNGVAPAVFVNPPYIKVETKGNTMFDQRIVRAKLVTNKTGSGW
jgi:hypothetical protein